MPPSPTTPSQPTTGAVDPSTLSRLANTEVFKRLGERFDQLARGATRATTSLGAMFVALESGVNGLTAGMARFVDAANPAAVRLFELALRNLQGAIGRLLLPALNSATEIIRALSDTITGLSQPVKRLLGGLALGGGLAGAFAAVATAVAVLVRTLGAGWLLLFNAVGAFAGVMATLQGASEVGAMARELFGKVFGMFSDVALAVGPPLLRIAGAVVRVLVAIADAIRPLILAGGQLLGAVLQPLAVVLDALAPVLVQVINLIGRLTQVILDLVNTLLNALGLARVEAGKPVEARPTPPAARTAQVGNPLDTVNRLYAAFFGAANLEKERTDAARKAAKHLESIDKKLDRKPGNPNPANLPDWQRVVVGDLGTKSAPDLKAAGDRLYRMFK